LRKITWDLRSLDHDSSKGELTESFGDQAKFSTIQYKDGQRNYFIFKGEKTIIGRFVNGVFMTHADLDKQKQFQRIVQKIQKRTQKQQKKMNSFMLRLSKMQETNRLMKQACDVTLNTTRFNHPVLQLVYPTAN
jgi:hypothetical protein